MKDPTITSASLSKRWAGEDILTIYGDVLHRGHYETRTELELRGTANQIANWLKRFAKVNARKDLRVTLIVDETGDAFGQYAAKHAKKQHGVTR